jgi:uncharacterized paraquat-inducible protein A
MITSTLESSTQHSVCPHCGRQLDSARLQSIIETLLGLLAGSALLLMLVPLGIIAWKSCADLLSDEGSHSILYHPLEDWSQR